ncbi:MAG TPA: Rap1a/Tai family immunity protein [Candidatus Cybelea sp.]|nr:Rap1a/Tai family immunity protein [Candidatus Cybelea sp.]
MRVTLMGVLAAFCLAASPGVAQQRGNPPANQTGRQLVAQCEAPAHQACLDTLHALTAKMSDDPGMCLPEEYDPEQVRDAYLDWAKDNPDELGKPAEETVREAMRDAFPCEE